MKSAIIAGGGLGGLAAALRLRARGWRVTLFESGPSLGGKMNLWENSGYRFDTGPSLITMPWVFRDLFEAAGSSLDEHVTLRPVHPLANYVFPDGCSFTYSSSLPEWIPTLRRIERRDVDGFFRFMHLGARLYEVSRRTFLNHAPFARPTRADLTALRHMPLRHAWGNYHRTVESHFRSPYLRQLFDRYPTYVGSSPYRAPATLAIIPWLEYAFGAYSVRGGLYRIVEGLVNLARAQGIDLVCNTRVRSVTHRARKVTGVRLADGAFVPADVVIMNGDPPGDPRESARKRTPSLSGFVMLLGLNRELPHCTENTICFSGDYRQEFRELFDDRRFPSDPTVYVNMPSRGDRSLAPPGGETLFIMANAPATAGKWDDIRIQDARSRVLRRLQQSGFPDLAPHIVVSDVWTPERIADRYLMPGGAIYGAASHGWRDSFLRPPNQVRGMSGLYRVGGSTHPGGGTPTVLLSAKITCDLIERSH